VFGTFLLLSPSIAVYSPDLFLKVFFIVCVDSVSRKLPTLRPAGSEIVQSRPFRQIHSLAFFSLFIAHERVFIKQWFFLCGESSPLSLLHCSPPLGNNCLKHSTPRIRNVTLMSCCSCDYNGCSPCPLFLSSRDPLTALPVYTSGSGLFASDTLFQRSLFPPGAPGSGFEDGHLLPLCALPMRIRIIGDGRISN